VNECECKILFTINSETENNKQGICSYLLKSKTEAFQIILHMELIMRILHITDIDGKDSSKYTYYSDFNGSTLRNKFPK